MNAVLPLLWYYRMVLLGTLVGLLLTGPCVTVTCWCWWWGCLVVDESEINFKVRRQQDDLYIDTY